MKWKKTSTVIGRGSTATVYLAGDSSSGELTAAKSTKLSLSGPLKREKSILSKLDSPYIVKYKGFEITEQHYTLFTEYHPLGTLRDEIQRRGKIRYDEPTVRSYTWQILKGLEYLHSIGIVHCDIKPSNVLMVDGQKRLKISDFGCSKFLSDDDEPLTFSGSPAFMAPEVVNGQRQGFESDLWSLGCTVVEMATGKIPWLGVIGDDPISALYRIGISGKSPEIPDWFSPEGKEFLSACFKREPEERLSATELLEHSFFHGLSPMTSSSEFESPRSVFDQSVWDSGYDDQSQSQGSFVDCCYYYSDRAAERIQRLTIVGSITSDDHKNDVSFDDDDEDWVTVRSNVNSNDIIISGNIRERRVALYFDECVEETDIVFNKSLKKENFRYLQSLPYLFL